MSEATQQPVAPWENESNNFSGIYRKYVTTTTIYGKLAALSKELCILHDLDKSKNSKAWQLTCTLLVRYVSSLLTDYATKPMREMCDSHESIHRVAGIERFIDLVRDFSAGESESGMDVSFDKFRASIEKEAEDCVNIHQQKMSTLLKEIADSMKPQGGVPPEQMN